MLDSGLKRTVAFCGFKGSGKDTAADHLVERFGYTKISLSYPLKVACKNIFDFSDEALWGASQFREEPDPRYVFSGKNPVDGTPLLKVARNERHYWLRESDGEWFPKFVSPRVALQTLGTEWGRRLYESIWLDACINHIRNTGNDKHTIPDVRFRNELAGIRNAGGVIVRLLRGERQSSHPSELEMESIPLEDFDFVVNNTGSKEYLFGSLDDLIEAVLAR
jgi:hypothetical protein